MTNRAKTETMGKTEKTETMANDELELNDADDADGETASASSADHGEAGEDAARNLQAGLEALLFLATEPVTIRQLRPAFPGVSRDALRAAMEALGARLAEPERGIQLQSIAGGYRLVTKEALEAHVRSFTAQKRKQKLSPAARETLAIVAYKQPITAPEITDIRGVDCTSAIKGLLERRLIRILGRKEVVGRPILYGSTKEFLLHFGLEGLEDLPTLEEFEELSAGMLGEPGELGEDGATEPADPGEVRDLLRAHDAHDALERQRDDDEEDADDEPEEAPADALFLDAPDGEEE